MPYHTKEDQEEINKIASRLEHDETVEILAKQSRMKPVVLMAIDLFVWN